MYYIDYHTHSRCSFDSDASLTHMVRAAQAAGMRELCVTDHCDLVDEHGQRVCAWDWNKSLAQFDDARQKLAREGFTLRLGLEFGMGHIDPPCSGTILSQPRLDFVIGSIHNYSPQKGSGDFYYADMSTPEACAAILDDYFFSMEQLVQSPWFDILGHIIYPLRYMGGNATIHPWMDRVSDIMKTVIDSGRGIEVNTWCGRTIAGWEPVLRRYKDLGGQIITVGSDAHAPANVGAGIPEAYDLLKALGFKAVCIYDKHTPAFIDL